MRPHEKQRQDFKPEHLFCDVALLVCQARVPDPHKGRTEGPHCPSGKTADSSDHVCDAGNLFCEEAARISKKSLELWASQLPLSIQVMAVPNECAIDDVQCPSASIVLERWICQVHPRRNPDESLLPAQFLLQAVRSHLHFSLLSAWLTKAKGKLPFKIQCLTSLPGEEWKSNRNDGSYETHHFPTYQVGKSLVLSVSVQSLPRSEQTPLLRCLCGDSPSVPSVSCSIEALRDDGSVVEKQKTDANKPHSFRLKKSGDSVVGTGGTSCRTPPISLPQRRIKQIPVTDSSVENPLFNPNKSTGDELRAKIDALSLQQADGIIENSQKSPVRRKYREQCTEGNGAVKFYIDAEEAGSSPAQNRLSPPLRDRSYGSQGVAKRKKRPSQKILFSAEDEVILSEDDGGSDFLLKSTLDEAAAGPSSETPFRAVFQQLNSEHANEFDESDIPSCSKDNLRKTSFTEGFWTQKKGNTYKPADVNTRPLPFVFPTDKKPGNSKKHNLARQLMADGGRFCRRTGLPLSSSPAPLKRNPYSFDYDTSLTSVSSIRSALYYDHDSGSSDSESGTSLCKSAPASTNLLGNFEESALNGRIKPFGSIDGFILDLAASGAFCPPHAALKVITFFFNVSDDNAPSPYLGHCSLDNVGRKGYHLPRKGTVQATLFNPQGTVVKMFVVRYDLSEMPPSCQTFVRQRTFFMPSSASLQDAARNRSWLRYLIHLRLATSRSGKLYLHTDIRMLFSRKSELDANNLETESGGTISSADAGNYELRSFTEMPKNPKFSPKKLGNHTNIRCEKKDVA